MKITFNYYLYVVFFCAENRISLNWLIGISVTSNKLCIHHENKFSNSKYLVCRKASLGCAFFGGEGGQFIFLLPKKRI